MNSNKSAVGRAKHRQAFGHDFLSRLVKLDLERWANRERKKRPAPQFFPSIAALMKARRAP